MKAPPNNNLFHELAMKGYYKMNTMSMRIGTLKVSPMRIPPLSELLLRPFVALTAEIKPPSSNNPLLDEVAARFNWTAREKWEQGEQMRDESEMATMGIDGKLEGWPSEVPPNCPLCKQRLRLDETCAACGWGEIPFLAAGDINWAEADCGT